MRFIGKWITMLLLASAAYGQDVALFTEDFPPEEFRSRRERVYDAIGANALALIQGAPSPPGYVRFRQSNSFYYLSGVESPHAYLLLDSAERETRLYLPHRNPGRERSEGKLLSAEDDELTRELTGVDAVYGIDILSEHLARFASRGRVPALYTPFKPAEGAAMSPRPRHPRRFGHRKRSVGRPSDPRSTFLEPHSRALPAVCGARSFIHPRPNATGEEPARDRAHSQRPPDFPGSR